MNLLFGKRTLSWIFIVCLTLVISANANAQQLNIQQKKDTHFVSVSNGKGSSNFLSPIATIDDFKSGIFFLSNIKC